MFIEVLALAAPAACTVQPSLWHCLILRLSALIAGVFSFGQADFCNALSLYIFACLCI